MAEQMESGLRWRGGKNLVALAYYAGSWIFSRYLGRENCYPIITVTQPQQQQLNNEACFFFPLNTQKNRKTSDFTDNKSI